MTCQEVQEDLLDWREGALAEARASDLKSHLDACPDCQDELNSMQRLEDELPALAAASSRRPWPPDRRPHLATNELSALAQGPAVEINGFILAKWRHMLDCVECRDSCAWLRRRLLHPESLEGIEIEQDLEQLVVMWEQMRLVVACYWSGALLSVRASVGVAREKTRGPREAHVVEHHLGQFAVSLTLMPDDPNKKSCRLNVGLKAETSAEAHAALYRGDEGLVSSPAFHEGQARFPSLAPGQYHLELFSGGRLIGSAALPIR